MQRKNEAGEWVGGAAYYLRALGGGISGGKFLGRWYAIGLMIELVPSLCLRLCHNFSVHNTGR